MNSFSDQKRTIPSPGISAKQATEIARSKGFVITNATMYKWVRTYGIGKKIGGRFYIDKDKLLYLLKYGME